MKTKIIAVLTSFCIVFTVPALAMAKDMSSGIGSGAADMFEASSTESIEAARLSEKEMKETEGEVLPLVAGVLMSGAIGAWTHHGQQYLETGELGTSGGAAMAAGTSMATTAVSGGIGHAAKLGKAGKTALSIRGEAQNQLVNNTLNPDNM